MDPPFPVAQGVIGRGVESKGEGGKRVGLSQALPLGSLSLRGEKCCQK